jgi:hypothetical protein
MRTAARNIFTTIRTEGALLPADFLQHVAEGNREIEGLSPDSYHLVPGEKLNEAINRTWNRLLGAWTGFKDASEKLGASDLGIGLTRERWLLPLFQELGYGRLQTAKAFEIDNKSYPISHGWQGTPIHLVGCKIDLDRRTSGVVGAARTSPHGLVQEMLNRSEAHLWGFVSNGHRLRILRDNITLTRQAFVEFDLAAMFDGEVYADFVVLWLLCHESRVEGERPELCWLEKWSQLAEKRGTRVLDDLRTGVEAAINALGSGFLAHPANRELRTKLSSATFNSQDYYRQLLRVIYRILFLFVAEGRGLLFEPKSSVAARELYSRFYSIARLRRLAERRAGTQHPDLWRGLTLVFEKLDTGCEELALPALGSFLWSREAALEITGCELANRDLLKAIHSLAFTVDGRVRRLVDYKNLGPEELGSIYEALLEQHPQLNVDAATFTLSTVAGNERKTTGSYYTPTGLVNCLLDSALDPVLDEACKKPKPERALLDLKICDPATGSGHFLIAAAHRLAKRLAASRVGDEEPSPEATRTALRDVIGRCLYGVDVNPMAVELCKVSLWIEALEPGKPLSFLDHRIRCGNSLLGATPELISQGIPDDAFEAIEGDDKRACSSLKKLNARERRGFGELFIEEDNAIRERLRLAAAAIDGIGDDRPGDIHRKEAAFSAAQQNNDFQKAKDLADFWCAAFVVKKRFLSAPTPSVIGDQLLAVTEPPIPTVVQNGLFGALEEVAATKSKPSLTLNPQLATASVGITTQHLRTFAHSGSLDEDLMVETRQLTASYRFFHWHLCFPEVFARGGFDIVVGNPPWEMPEVDDREFFASTISEISAESSAQIRRAMIATLATKNPSVHEQWKEYVRRYEGERAFFARSGRYPNASSGRLNYYKLFVESGWCSVAKAGRLGMVVPSVLTTNAYERPLWHSLVKPGYVAAAFDFENTNGLFPSIHRAMKFSLITVLRTPLPRFQIGCWLREAGDVRDPLRVMTLSVEELVKFSPEELALPQFRWRSDLELLTFATDKLGRLNDHADWRYTPRLMFSSSDDVFRPVHRETVNSSQLNLQNRRVTSDGVVLVPVYEGKMVGILDHRQADIYINPRNAARQAQERPIPEAEKEDANRFAVPQFWLREDAVRQRRFGKTQGDWELVFCDVTSATNERTALSCIIPLSGLTRNLPAIYLKSNAGTDVAILVGVFSTFVFDYFTRLKVSSNHLTQGILATLPIPALYRIRNFAVLALGEPEWFEKRALELSYVAWDLKPFAQDCGCPGPPFLWDEKRRFLLRCELDAAFFHLYIGTIREWMDQANSLRRTFPNPRDAVSYIMDTFPIVKRRDEGEYGGKYHTKDTILGIYDEMAEAARTGGQYHSRLNPPPADPSVAHLAQSLPVLGAS